MNVCLVHYLIMTSFSDQGEVNFKSNIIHLCHLCSYSIIVTIETGELML